MRGYIALTDFGWFSFLAGRSAWDEVNFWQPRGGSLLDPPIGAPFFFKLHARYGSWIVGFGQFAWRSKLPAWMAWESFREANGSPDRRSFLELLAVRRSEPLDITGNFNIGCLLISRPVFFEPSAWVQPPADWPRSGIQQGKFYDLDVDEGLRVYQACLERAVSYPHSAPAAGGAQLHTDETRARFGSPYLVRPRLGQGGFRIAVTDAYERRCAITSEHSLPVLEAAHIRPYGVGGEHEVRNGLLIRADLHRLFDQGLITVTPELRLRVSQRLRDDYQNGRTYYELQEKLEVTGGILVPRSPEFKPDPELLRWHMTEKFVA